MTLFGGVKVMSIVSQSSLHESRYGLGLTEKTQGSSDGGTLSPRLNVPDVLRTLYFTLPNGMRDAFSKNIVERLITTRN